MGNTWVLVANATKGRLFEEGRDGVLRELTDYTNPAGRLEAHEVEPVPTPRIGENAGSTGHTTHPHADLHDKAAHHFALDLRDELERVRAAGRCARIVLVAPAKFLGTLIKSANRNVRAIVAAQIDKDMTLAPAAEIAAELSSHEQLRKSA